MAVDARADVSEDTQVSQKPDATATALQDEARPTSLEEARSYQVASVGDDLPIPSLEVVDANAEHEAALKTTAQQIYSKMNPGFPWSPDFKAVSDILDPMSDADRAKVEQYYPAVPGNSAKVSLRQDITRLGAVEYRTVEAMLDRKDGETNHAGNVMVALETARREGDGLWDSVSVKGSAMLRASLSTLDSKGFEELEQTFQVKYGKSLDQAIGETIGISEADKALLPYWRKGVDGRQTADFDAMARLAVASKDLPMLASVLAGDATKDARTALAADAAFMQDLSNKFGRSQRGTVIETTELKVARDLIREGNISLATIVTGNKDVLAGFLDNKVGTEQALQRATPEERRLLTEGRMAADALKTNPNATLTEDQLKAKAYFDTINAALQNFTEREREVLLDQGEHGRKTVISNMADQHTDKWLLGLLGGDHKMQNLFAQVESMSAADHALLTNPNTRDRFRSQIEHSLTTYEPDAARRARIMALIDAKTAPTELPNGALKWPTYQEAQAVRRSLADVLADNTDNSVEARKAVAESIVAMTPADAAKYKNEAEFRASVDRVFEQANGDSSDIAAAFLAQSLLKQVAETGTLPQLGPVEAFAQSVMKGEGDTNTRITNAQDLIRTSESLRQHLLQLQAPINERGPGAQLDFTKLDRSMYQMFTSVFMAGGGLQGEMAYKDTLEGRATPQWDVLRTGGSAFTTQKLYGTYDRIAALPADQRQVRMDFMNADQRLITEKVIAQGGQVKLEDRMRSFIIGDGGELSDFQAELTTLSKDPVARQAVFDSYSTKYGGNLAEAFMAKVPSADRIQYEALLGDQTAQQQFFDRTEQVHQSGGFTLDASRLQLERTLGINQAMIQKYEAMRQALPQELQDAISQQYSDSLRNFEQSKERLADAATDTVFVIAAVASVIATWGMDAPAVAALIPHLAASGAASRTAIQAAIKGGDLEGSEAFQQALRGALEGASLGIVIPMGPTVRVAGAVDNEAAALVRNGDSLVARAGDEAVVPPSTTDEAIAAQRLEQRQAAEAAAEERRLAAAAEEQRIADEAAEAQRLEQQRIADEAAEAQRLEQQRIADEAAEERRLAAVAEEQRIADEAAEERRLAAVAEEQRLADEAAEAQRLEQQRIADEAAEERRLAAVAEEQRLADEAAEAQRLEQQRIADEAAERERVTAAGTIAGQTDNVIAGQTDNVIAGQTDNVIAGQTDNLAAAQIDNAAGRAVDDPTYFPGFAPIPGIDDVMRIGSTPLSVATRQFLARGAVIAAQMEELRRISAAQQQIADAAVNPSAPHPESIEPAVVPEVEPVKEVLEAVPMPNADAILLATVKRGEGPYQSAARILEAATGKRPDHPEVMKLTRAMQRTYTWERDGNSDMSGLPVGHNFITSENFAHLLQEIPDEAMRELLKSKFSVPQG